MHAPIAPDLLDPELLLLAYRSGIFPMSDARDDPEVFWVEPRYRAVIPLDQFRISKSLRKTLRKDRFRVSCNEAFSAVIEACAAPRDDDDGTGSWISHRIQASYENLHRLGHAHSIECWDGERLIGGLYGVGFDRAFCGESMFSRETDASKVALAWLVAAMRSGGFTLLDCQFQTPHLASMGAVEISRERYVAALADAQRPYSEGAGALSLDEAFARLPPPVDLATGPPSPGYAISQFLTQTS